MEPASLHPRFHASLEAALHCLTTYLGDDLLGACVVGSSVCLDWDEGSDLDLVIITEEKLDYTVITGLEEQLQPQSAIRVQLINLQPDYLHDYHLQNHTTMAHSIRRGLVVLDKGQHFDVFKQLTDADLPRREWIKEYFFKFSSVYFLGLHWLEWDRELQKVNGCSCNDEVDYPNDLCRAIVNFSILYLELHGIIPITKRQIIRGLREISMPESLIGDVFDSMYIRREDRQIDVKEAERFCVTARELKERIQELLCIRDGELAKHDVRRLLEAKETGNL